MLFIDLFKLPAHRGTLNAGHYVAVVQEKGKWWVLDDDKSTECDSEPFRQFFGDSSRNCMTAYMLCYRKVAESSQALDSSVAKTIDTIFKSMKVSSSADQTQASRASFGTQNTLIPLSSSVDQSCAIFGTQNTLVAETAVTLMPPPPPTPLASQIHPIGLSSICTQI